MADTSSNISNMPPRLPNNGNFSNENDETRPPASRKSKKKPPKPKDNIGAMEWIFFFVVCVVTDYIQMQLTALVIGVVANRFIDIAFGFNLFIYCLLRGLTSVKQIASVITAFGLEFSGFGDLFPFWTADMILIMLWHKAELKAKSISLENTALKTRYLRRVARTLPFMEKTESEEGELENTSSSKMPANLEEGNDAFAQNQRRPGALGREGYRVTDGGEYRVDEKGMPVYELGYLPQNPKAGRIASQKKSGQGGSISPSNNIVDLRNLTHERNQGKENNYKEAA